LTSSNRDSTQVCNDETLYRKHPKHWDDINKSRKLRRQ